MKVDFGRFMKGMNGITDAHIFVWRSHPLLQNGALFFYMFRRIDALLQRLLVLLRSILSEPSDERENLSSVFFVQLRFNMFCSATDVS